MSSSTEYTSCLQCAKADPTLTYVPEETLWSAEKKGEK